MLEKETPAEDAGKNSDHAPAVVESEDVTVEVEVAEVVEVEVVEEPPKPKAKPKAEKTEQPKVEKVKTEDAVEVALAAMKYSARKRNSLSVSVLQDRLAELDYAGARSDLRGWFHDGTRAAVEKWQEDNRAEVTGEVSLSDAEGIFRGTGVKVS
jgi:hypothetical protein